MVCCVRMQAQLELTCAQHDDLIDCPDSLVTRWSDSTYGLRVHDGGSSVVTIDYCPWCGVRLSPKA